MRDALSLTARAIGDAMSWFFCKFDEERAVAAPEWLEFLSNFFCLLDEALTDLVRAT